MPGHKPKGSFLLSHYLFPLALIILPATVLKIPPTLICQESQQGLTSLENLRVIVRFHSGVNISGKLLGFKQWALTPLLEFQIKNYPSTKNVDDLQYMINVFYQRLG